MNGLNGIFDNIVDIDVSVKQEIEDGVRNDYPDGLENLKEKGMQQDGNDKAIDIHNTSDGEAPAVKVELDLHDEIQEAEYSGGLLEQSSSRNQKASRAKNFTEEETVVLTEVVGNYRQVIECKQSNTYTWSQKEAVWKSVANDFNKRLGLSGGSARSAYQLRTKYDNLKKVTKAKLAKERQSFYKTGSGRRETIRRSVAEENIIMLLHDNGQGLHFMYDPEIHTEAESSQINLQDRDERRPSGEHTREKYTPGDSRKPIHLLLSNAEVKEGGENGNNTIECLDEEVEELPRPVAVTGPTIVLRSNEKSMGDLENEEDEEGESDYWEDDDISTEEDESFVLPTVQIKNSFEGNSKEENIEEIPVTIKVEEEDFGVTYDKEEVDEWNIADVKIENDLENGPTTTARRRRMCCGPCGLTFKDRTEFLLHKTMHTGLSRYECNECGNVYKWKHSLLEHKKIHSDIKPFQCTDCGKTFKWKQSLVDHEKMHSDDRPHVCQECGKTFKWKQCLVDHGKIHSDERPHVCKECGMSFKWKHILIDHEKVHTGIRPFACQDCDKAFSKRYHLTVHSRVHTGVKPFACDECGKRFRWKRRLVFHKRHHGGVKPFVCNSCGKGFYARCELVVHERIHTGIRPYECKTCGKTFTIKSTLTMHEKIHSDIQPYTCGECGKAYKNKSTLVCHERIHSGIKPYSCPQCDKTFAVKSSLISHIRKHTGDKPFRCGHCGKNFARRRNLLDHERIHTGDKPFVCPQCDKGFSIKASLKAHLRKHTGEKPHSCGICGTSFTHRYHLLAHERLHSKKGKVLRSCIKKKNKSPDTEESNSLEEEPTLMSVDT